MEALLQRSISTIHERYQEPLSLDELADAATMSKYHFLRVFHRGIGITPGRFVSAVRLQNAKRELLRTPSTVTDISVTVGYSSTGSFTRRFTEMVRIPPTLYRQFGRGQLQVQLEPTTAAPHQQYGVLTGSLLTHGLALGDIHVGVYESSILQGHPAAFATTGSNRFQIRQVPAGTWYIHAVARGAHESTAPHGDLPLLTAVLGPVHVRPNSSLHLNLTLRPEDWSAPPVVSVLPDIGPLISTEPQILTDYGLRGRSAA